MKICDEPVYSVSLFHELFSNMLKFGRKCYCVVWGHFAAKHYVCENCEAKLLVILVLNKY